MKMNILVLFISIFFSIFYSQAQEKNLYDYFPEFAELYNSGDFLAAEDCMMIVLDPENNSPKSYLIAAYNNLGLVKKSIGLYSEALEYYNKSENLATGDRRYLVDLVDIYNNKSRIYTFWRSFPTAIEYLEQVSRIYHSIDNPDTELLLKISRAYLNLGIVYYESGNYIKALDNLEESLRLKVKHKLPEIELTYLNLAKTYAKIKDFNKADDFFRKSINSMKSQFGENYYRMAEIFFDYGLFLRTTGNYDESIIINHKALSICRKNYGEKHPYVSQSLRNLGDYHLQISNYDSALYYYQRSLISIVYNFSETDINKNPSLDSVIFNVELLKTFRKKAETLELLASQKTESKIKISILSKSLETVDLALQLIDRIRNDYLTEESRMYLAENEKETYFSAVHVAGSLYELTGESSYIGRMYRIACKAKAAVLRNEITENELLSASGIPDSLNEKQTSLSANIAAYNNLILEESQKTNPDSSKLSLWKDALFDMNREMENVSEEINSKYPAIRELLQKTEPLTLDDIQKHLHSNETIVDYLLSNQYREGKRALYTFIISGKSIDFRLSFIDSLFMQNAEIIMDHGMPHHYEDEFRKYTGALDFMYKNLIEPVEETFAGNRLIIIPDEEIAWLPFEAFVKDVPARDQADYGQLQYLIRDYTFSYSYSSSLAFSSSKRSGRAGVKVFAFLPDYGSNNISAEVSGELPGAEKEIGSISGRFRGKRYTAGEATESNFRIAVREPAIFHLAMHSVADTVNSKYSWLAFDTGTDTLEDGRLYNYEISLMRIKSPMVVLSACNSGTGTLYHGEGLMSIARSFILAGASSVVRTSWEINDETSAKIIAGFYNNLSRGMHKNEALRRAKLDYLANSSPSLSDPWYWAAYEVLGDNTPVAGNKKWMIILIVTILAVVIIFTNYFRRRSIFSDRSL